MNLPWSAAGLELLFPCEDQHVGCRSSGLEQQSWELVPQVRVACVGWGGSFWCPGQTELPEQVHRAVGSKVVPDIFARGWTFPLLSPTSPLVVMLWHVNLSTSYGCLCLQICHDCWFYVLPTLWHCAGRSISLIAFFLDSPAPQLFPFSLSSCWFKPFKLVKAWAWCSENWGGSYCGHPQYTSTKPSHWRKVPQNIYLS